MTTSPRARPDQPGTDEGGMEIAGTDIAMHWDRQVESLDVTLEGDPHTAAPEVVAAVIAAIDRVATEQHAAPLRLIADHPPTEILPLPDAVAEGLGLASTRDLWQLRRPLPIPSDHQRRYGLPQVHLRSFEPGQDDDAWVRVNDRAFADHPDQGGQTVEQLRATLAEDWVDLDGFLVVDDQTRVGELAGFCWTRVHPATHDDPEIGEIYVIGVHPSRHGVGLGAALVLAGLDHLSSHGVTIAMLYVEADNAPARRLYDRLGFEPHLRRRISSR